MEVERRESRDPRQVLELQSRVEMREDMIHDGVDAYDVVDSRKIREVRRGGCFYHRDMASRRFYEALGFAPFPGSEAENMVILRNGAATIGLFHGMFEGNLLTFNPGWDSDAHALDEFVDVRDIQRRLRAAGIPLTLEADESGTGPASLIVTDPDGNAILLDQHV